MPRIIYLQLFFFLYFWLVNSLFILCLGLQVGGKLAHNLPPQGSLGRGRYFKTFLLFFLVLCLINFESILF